MNPLFSSIHRWIWSCIWAASFTQSCCAQQMTANPASTAVVHIRVNTAYDDSERSLALLKAIAFYAPVRQITVVPGDTLDGLFVREYGFGVSDLPKSYKLLLESILEKNHLARAEELRPGPLIIPAVPRRAWMGWGRKNPQNYVSNMTIYSSESVAPASKAANRAPQTATATLAESPPPELAFRASTLADEHRFTAPSETVSLEMPVKPADSLVESALFGPGVVTAFTHSIPILLAADNKCDTEPDSRDHQTLTIDQKNKIAQLLKDQSQRSPVLFILDTGWPSYSDYAQSREALYKILDAVWKSKFGTGFQHAPAQAQIQPASNEHCRCIQRALKELQTLQQGLDPAKMIQVIYVPLTREQGASTILTDLLQTSALLQRLTAEEGTINSKIVRGTRDYARSLVAKYYPAQWSGQTVQTDKSVMDAVLLIGQAYAEQAQTVFFANESWTVEHGGKYYVQYQTPQYGMVTSAAGNDGTTNLLDFAQRSALTKDTMAIINMTGSGVDQTSTRLDDQNIDVAMAAGFDGMVTDDISGTSFSAPRIAWFLAAGEAVRKKPLVMKQWGIDLWRQLVLLRDPSAAGNQKLLFDPVKYISAQAAAQDH
ncbi:MAG TPA: hypothetical protein VFR24_10210 [Candidatus Angelobacter sp.]|nr:hypothetical protein [Candidatus Angelobacter sp.]